MSRLLLDTHALLWFVSDDGALSASARALIENEDEVFVSVASAWEAAIVHLSLVARENFAAYALTTFW